MVPLTNSTEMGAKAMRANAGWPCRTASVLESSRIILGMKRLFTKVKSTIQGSITTSLPQSSIFLFLLDAFSTENIP